MAKRSDKNTAQGLGYFALFIFIVCFFGTLKLGAPALAALIVAGIMAVVVLVLIVIVSRRYSGHV